jgi:phosphohistidine phosphatase SixA
MSNDYSRRRLFVAAFALAAVSALGCGESCACEGPKPEPADVTVYIVRHAEKQALPETAPQADREDPPLSRDGQVRAMGLPEDVPVREISAVYVTKTKRSADTASAVMALNSIEPIYYPPQDVDGLVARLRKRHGQKVLVVGHSNTIPPLLRGLGVQDVVEIDESQYGDLWVVTLSAAGATVELRRFGESVERFDPGR